MKEYRVQQIEAVVNGWVMVVEDESGHFDKYFKNTNDLIELLKNEKEPHLIEL